VTVFVKCTAQYMLKKPDNIKKGLTAEFPKGKDALSEICSPSDERNFNRSDLWN